MKPTTIATILGAIFHGAFPVAAEVASAAPRPLSNAQFAELNKQAMALRLKFLRLKDADVVERFKADDPDLKALSAICERLYESEELRALEKDPQFDKWVSSALDLLPTLGMETKDEVVSLRPEFEKLGVVAHQQVGTTCVVHAAYHMYQYQCRKAGLAVPSYRDFERRMKGGFVSHLSVIRGADGRRLKMLKLGTLGLGALDREVIKDQLRKGHPCMIRLEHKNHSVLAVGFTTKNGKTTFEYLDSGRTWENKGYHTVRASSSVNIGVWHYSAWYE